MFDVAELYGFGLGMCDVVFADNLLVACWFVMVCCLFCLWLLVYCLLI